MNIRTRARRAFAATACALALTLGIAGCSGESVVSTLATLTPDHSLPSDTQKELTSAVTTAMTASGASGAIVGVWVPWSGSWIDGVGTVAPGSKTPVDDAMTFRAGTVTRAMTCDVLYGLVDDGKVELSDPVTDYVGGIPKYGHVTLKQLCDGTSGIGSYDSMLKAQSLNNPDRVWSQNELIGYGVGQNGSDISPGEGFRDSDAGYVLLGLALQRASGKSGQELFQKYVFEPLGLTQSALPGSDPATPEVGASTPLRGFFLPDGSTPTCTKQTEITEQSASYGSTDAGVVTDIRDLAAYVRTLATAAPGSDDGRFSGPLPVTSSAPSWFTTVGGAVQVGPLVGQYGDARGYLTAAFSDPKTGLTVAVVLNNSSADRGVVLDLAEQLAAIAANTPADKGEHAEAVGLPWTAEQAQKQITDGAIYQPAKK